VTVKVECFVVLCWNVSCYGKQYLTVTVNALLKWLPIR